jgi:hypothetical protein
MNSFYVELLDDHSRRVVASYNVEAIDAESALEMAHDLFNLTQSDYTTERPQ